MSPPWHQELTGRTLRVDVTAGMLAADWERLLDGVVREISAVDLVVLVARPTVENGLTYEKLLHALVESLEKRGVSTRIERER